MEFRGRTRLLAPETGGGGGGLLLSCRPGSFGSAAGQALEILPTLGIRAVEVSLPQPAGTTALQRDLARHGLRAASLQVDLDLDHEDVEGHAASLARRAVEEFGTHLLFVSVSTGGKPREQRYEALRRAGDGAGRHGVSFIVETHPDLGTNGQVAAATMAAVNHPHVRVNWDPANVHYYNHELDHRAEFDLVLPHLGGVHLKDTLGGYHAWAFCTLGEGVVDFPHIVSRLVEIGFQGPCTMEIEGVQGEKLTPEQYVGRVRASVDYLRSLGHFLLA